VPAAWCPCPSVELLVCCESITQKIPTSQRWYWGRRRRSSVSSTTRRTRTSSSAASTTDKSSTGTLARVLSRSTCPSLSTAIATRPTRSSGFRQKPAPSASRHPPTARWMISHSSSSPLVLLSRSEVIEREGWKRGRQVIPWRTSPAPPSRLSLKLLRKKKIG